MRFFCLDRGQRLLLRKYWPFGLALGEIWGTALIIRGCSCLSAAVLAGAVLGLALALRLGFLRQAAAVLLVFGLSAVLGAARARGERAALAVDPLLGLQHSILAVRGRIAVHSKSGPEGMRALFLAEQTAVVPFNGCRDLLWRDLQEEVPLWLTWPGTRKYELGTRLELRGRLKAVEGGGGFADYCRRRGIRWSMRSEDIRQVPEAPGLAGKIRELLQNLRAYLNAAALNSLSEENAALFLAMALGDGSFLNDDLQCRLRIVGLGHVLAASGLHVGLLLGAVFWAVRRCGFSRRHGALLAWTVAMVYAALAGFTPSIVRAVLMASLFLAALVCGRPGALGRSWALALALTLLVSPLQLDNAGFQLSYAAVAGIALWYGRLNRAGTGFLVRRGVRLNWLSGYIIGSLALTLSVSLTLWPLLLYHFGQFAFLSFISNLLVLPVLEMALGVGMAAWLGDAAGLGRFLWPVCAQLENLALWEVRCLNRCPAALICADFPAAAAAAYYLLLSGVRLWLYAAEMGAAYSFPPRSATP